MSMWILPTALANHSEVKGQDELPGDFTSDEGIQEALDNIKESQIRMMKAKDSHLKRMIRGNFMEMVRRGVCKTRPRRESL